MKFEPCFASGNPEADFWLSLFWLTLAWGIGHFVGKALVDKWKSR